MHLVQQVIDLANALQFTKKDASGELSKDQAACFVCPQLAFSSFTEDASDPFLFEHRASATGDI